MSKPTTRVLEDVIKKSDISVESVVKTINMCAKNAHASQPSFVASEQALADATSYLESCYLGVYAFNVEKFYSYLNESVPSSATSGSYKSQYISILGRLTEMGSVRTRLETLLLKYENQISLTDEQKAIYAAAQTCMTILRAEYGSAVTTSNKILNVEP